MADGVGQEPKRAQQMKKKKCVESRPSRQSPGKIGVYPDSFRERAYLVTESARKSRKSSKQDEKDNNKTGSGYNSKLKQTDESVVDETRQEYKPSTSVPKDLFHISGDHSQTHLSSLCENCIYQAIQSGRGSVNGRCRDCVGFPGFLAEMETGIDTSSVNVRHVNSDEASIDHDKTREDAKLSAEPREVKEEMASISIEGKSQSKATGGISPSLSRATSSASNSAESSNVLRIHSQGSGRNHKLEPFCWHCHKSSYTMSRSSTSSEEVYEGTEPELPFDFLVFDDWDSGLSSNSNEVFFLDDDDDDDDDDDWDDAMSMIGSLGRPITHEDLKRRRSQEAAPHYPHRALYFHECEVCLTSSYLRRRVCCDFHICNECMQTYVRMKVNGGKVQIECPNDRCSVLIHRDEINDRLSKEMKNKFAKFLVDANADPCEKTCPSCSTAHRIEAERLSNKKKLKSGLKVICPQCKLQWCFLCQAPFHAEITCKQYRKGDEMVRRWAKERSYGQSNAQRCPKCKIFIQKVHGCDHMKCTRCNTDFCYRCGDRYISIKLLGNHCSRFSLFGCKYRLMPEKPALRRLIRGANFAARLVAGLGLAVFGLAVGAVLVGASVVIIPGYGIFRLRRHIGLKERRKRKKLMEMEYAYVARQRELMRELRQEMMMQSHGTSSTNEESESGNPDTQQVQVIVHRSVSFSHEEPEPVSLAVAEDCDLFINRYTGEGTEMVVTSSSGNDKSDDVVVVADVKEIPNEDGYATVVANFVAKASGAHDSSEKVKTATQDRKGVQGDENEGIEPNFSKDSVKVMKGDKTKGSKKNDESENPSDENSVPGKETPLSSENLADSKTVSECVDPNLESGQTTTVVNCRKISDPSSMNTKTENMTALGDADSTEGCSNGCFGYIFSKRLSAQTNEDPNIKCSLSHSQKKFLSRKAATWEKCRRDGVQSLLKSNLSDQNADLKNLSVMMGKSTAPATTLASMKYLDILSPENKCPQVIDSEVRLDMKSPELAVLTGSDSCPVKEITLQNVGHEVDQEVADGLKDEDSEVNGDDLNSLEPDFVPETENSSSGNKLLHTSADECYVSQYSVVTYL